MRLNAQPSRLRAARLPHITFFAALASRHSLLGKEAIQDGGGNPQHAIASFVKAFGRSEVNHAGFFLETTADRIPAEL
jgi:hypothetical protein